MRRRPWMFRAAALAALALAACDEAGARKIAAAHVPECVRCHGGEEDATGALPAGTGFDPGGAHSAHVAAGPLAGAFACAECHPDPRTASGSHMDGSVDVVFGPLATSLGRAPAYAGDGGTCSDVYCHGATLSGTAPSWNGGPAAATCGACHGVPPLVGHVQSTECGSCHDGYTSTSVNVATHVNGSRDVAGLSCTSCHGDAGRPGADPWIAAMPPIGTHGETESTDPAVGAHLAHLTAGTLARAFSCIDCHPVPTSTSHSNGAVDFDWSVLAKGTGAPAYDPTDHTCASTYCHGSFAYGDVANEPSWIGGAGAAACGTCHGTPPEAPHLQNPDCGSCHAGYTAATINPVDHVNGIPDVSLTCTSCHGRNGVSPAPPVDTANRSATTLVSVGAHQAHVAPTLRPAIACTECHGAAAASYTTTHLDTTVQTGFGPLANQGTTTVWNRGAGTCAATYCHGGSNAAWGGLDPTPVWTTVTGRYKECTSCHGDPPVALHVQRTDCGSCHAGYTSTSVNVATHVNGSVDVVGLSCTSCHGRDGVNPAPPVDTANRSATTLVSVGAHQAHVAPTLRAGIACTECHGAAAASYTSSHPDATVQIAFGALANQGTGTAWDPAAGTCATSYCHGGSSALQGGTDPTPVWTTVTGKYSECTSYHGDPPPLTASGRYHPQNTSCSGCHGTGFDTAAVDPSQHVNGSVALPQRSGACNRCHGSLDGYAPAAAADPNAIAAPGTAASARPLAVGAHQAHVNPAGSQYAAPIRCTECHGPDKLAPADHADGSALPVWTSATLATAAGMTSPTYASGACASTYCHGKYSTSAYGGATTPSPTWGASGKLWCDSCHGDPPARRTDGTTPHSSSGACSACHAGYADKGTDSSPRAVSLARHLNAIVEVDPPTGGADCAVCHDALASAMRSTSTGYHHLMSNTSAAANLGGGKYPTSDLGGASDPQRRCLMCHVDHDAFAAGTRSSNLRASYGSTIAASNRDFDPSGGGLCISCHYRSLAKSYFQADGTLQTPAIGGGATAQDAAASFGASAHGFETMSTFSDGTTFRASCSKCHSDTLAKEKQTSSHPNLFGLHDSTVSAMLHPGLAPGEPAEERFCTTCHSGGVARSDRFGVAAMSEASARLDRFVQLDASGTITVAAGATAVTGNGTSWYSVGSGAATFTQGSTAVTGSGTSWTGALVGRSIRNVGASPARWYTIVAVVSPTSLVIRPAYAEATAGSAAWATSIANWSLRCDADAWARWYSITGVTSATSLTIFPGYGGSPCSASAYVAVPAPGHPMQLEAGQHRAVEGGAPGWNGGTSRHVTCADCHDPHAAQPGNHVPGSDAIAGPNVGVWGVAATWASRTVSGVSLVNRSRTVTGAFLASDAGKNMRGPDGVVYPIAAATTTTLTIGSTVGYKGASTATGTVEVQDPSAAPSFTVRPQLTPSDPQYRLCLKCHGAYGASPPPPTAFFTPSGVGTTQPQTDVARDINPFQLAYHPIAAVGRNQPPIDANPNWASSPGRKLNAPNDGLDNTFVDGWGARSLVACSDCHGSESPDDAWGPHGSANQWLLKGIDPNVTVTLASGAVTYPNACYHKGTGNPLPGGVPDTGDSKNFCLNCHRADVYGLVTLTGSAGGTWCDWVTPVSSLVYANLSRVTHPVDNRTHSNSVNQGALTRFGIYCMQCHGGDSIGAIHGTNSTTVVSGASHPGKRFLVGATWTGVTRASPTAGVRCWTGPTDAVNTCAPGHTGSTGRTANYDYDSGAD